MSTVYLAGSSVPAGDPIEVLDDLHAAFPWKLAVGGMVGMKRDDKTRVLDRVFERVWPARVHALGLSTRTMLMRFPLHSVDATNWYTAPCRFGRWTAFGGHSLRIRGSHHNLRVEVEHFLDMERDARSRWRRDMARLERECGTWPLRTLS